MIRVITNRVLAIATSGKWRFLLLSLNTLGGNAETPRLPKITSDFWRICTMPELGDLNGPIPSKQHIVDHVFVMADNGKWQLWACMRGTEVSRLLFGWEGESLEIGPWTERGIVARADSRYGEQIRRVEGKRAETIGAPFF